MITTLTGKNAYELLAVKQDIIKDFVTKYGDFALENIDCVSVDAETVYDALTVLPFLAEKKLVVLVEPGKNKLVAEKLPTWLSGDIANSENTELLIIEPEIDRRSIFFKFLQKNTNLLDHREKDINSLPAWLAGQAKAQGGSLSLNDASFLVERVGFNQMMLSNELAKLVTYDLRISRENIILLTEQSPQSSIFELIDAALAGNHSKALELYGQQRAQKVEPQQIMSMLAWQLHILASVKAAKGAPLEVIAKTTGINPFLIRKNTTVANKLSLKQIKDLVFRTLALDLNLKSQTIDADDALQQLMLTF